MEALSAEGWAAAPLSGWDLSAALRAELLVVVALSTWAGVVVWSTLAVMVVGLESGQLAHQVALEPQVVYAGAILVFQLSEEDLVQTA